MPCEHALPAQVRALDILERLGASPAAENLRQTLQEASALALPRQPRASTRENPFGLTNHQVEVLALLIENLTNAQIADRLYISTKTAGHHVSAILARLNVDSRQEAADLARQHHYFNPQK